MKVEDAMSGLGWQMGVDHQTKNKWSK